MSYIIIEKKTLPRSEFFLSLELTAEYVNTHLRQVLLRLRKDTELPGFRKGFVPEKILKERVGEMALFEEAAMNALSRALGEVFAAEKLDVVGQPRVEATVLAPQNPAKFNVTLSLFPDLRLPDYKKIAAEHNGKKLERPKIEEGEIDAVVAEILKQYEDPNKVASGEKEFPLTEETVKKLGNFESVADFRAKVREGLTLRKEELQKEKRRAELLDALAKKSQGEIPDVLIESELSRMESELCAQLEKLGSSLENYLKEIKKDLNSLKKEWRADAEKRVRLQLVLHKIARTESLAASAEEIAAEVAHIMEHHKNTHLENARGYVETFLTNKKVIEFLENQK
ncbi:MAG: hypothetical protein HZB12_01380 [Candidatus Yonathbacteria bacterium]|nr:hypothetical protein [Candidatus Yonathbacteria bacterium]